MFSRNLKTLLKVALDRMGMFHALRRVYRALHPYHPDPAKGSVGALPQELMPQPFSRNSTLFPGVIIVKKGRCGHDE